MIDGVGMWPAVLEGLGLALALIAAWLVLRRRPSGRGAAIAWALVLVVGAGAAWFSATRLLPLALPPDNRPIATAREGYETSDACRSCHPDQYHSWHVSYHRTMTQVASRETVIPTFEEATADAFARHYRLFWRDDELWVEMDDPTWRELMVPAPRVELPIVMMTGSHHMQVYWYGTQNGPMIGMLPVAWEIHDERWMPVDTNFIFPPEDLHQRKPLQVAQWNQRCIACHTTRPIPALTGTPPEWETRATEFGIACEACHGPGEAHVAANQNPLRRYAMHLTDRPDDTIVNPARLPNDRSAEVCGRCHSVWNTPNEAEMAAFRTTGDRFVPGDVLEERGVSPSHGRETNPDSFWPDGAVRPQGREYSSLLRTACFTKGEMSCISCHQMHKPSDDPRPLEEWTTDQLAAGMRGDEACSSCHTDLMANLEAHTHHPAASSGSRCMNCHMPNTVLGVRKASRSHEIDSPRVATELASGRANACNLCHLDQTLAWTDEYLSKWYEQPRHDLEPVHHAVPGVLVHLLRGDAARRAISVWNLSWPEAVATAKAEEWSPPFLAQLLQDPYHAVRYMTYRSLRRHPLFADLEYEYLGSEEHWSRVSREVIERWETWRRSRGETATLDFVLRNEVPGGASDMTPAVFTELLEQRDDTPIRINE